jgi:hypothetical protein
MSAGGCASTQADDAAVLTGLVRVDGFDGSCFIHLADDAVINGIPHKVRDLRHPTAPESERGDCRRCTTLLRGSLRAIDTASAGFRSSSLHHTFATQTIVSARARYYLNRELNSVQNDMFSSCLTSTAFKSRRSNASIPDKSNIVVSFAICLTIQSPYSNTATRPTMF